MDQMSKQTEVRKPESYAAKRIVSAIFGIIEIILGLRLIFKLLGANSSNGFVKAIYDITQFFVKLFEGIFAKMTINAATKAVFEPATLIAIILVALVAWIILKLMTPRQTSRVEKTEYVSRPVSGDQPRPDSQPKPNSQPTSDNQPKPDNQPNPDNQPK